MSEKRIVVWVQEFKDRTNLMFQWIDPATGRRKSKSAKTADPEEAEDKRADLEYELTHGKYQEASRMSWERFREAFEAEYLPGLRPNTQGNHRTALNLFERLAAPRQLRSVGERTVSAFAAAMRTVDLPGRGKGMKASSIKTTLRLVRTALGWAAEQGLLPKCPRFPFVKVPNKKPQPVPAESFEKLLDKALDFQTKAYLMAGWLAGLRLEEAYLLEWGPTREAPYLDLEKDRIILPAEVAKSAEDQWVPLDPDLRTALEAVPRRGRRVFRFTDHRGVVVSAGAVSKRVRSLARSAGVKLTMHTLRKGFGCRYAGKVPAQVLQKLMRHSDIKTTMAFYANIGAAVEDAVFGGRRNTLRNSQPPVASENELAAERAGVEEERVCRNESP